MAIYYYLSVAAVAFGLMGLDKLAARAGARRVPERVFYILALLGGGPGILAGAFVFWHKVRKPVFILVAGLATLLHIAVAIR